MDKHTASLVLDSAVQKLRKLGYEHLRSFVSNSQCNEVVGPDGKAYQVEFVAFWDDPRKTDGHLRIVASIDDGSFLAAFHPLTTGFIMAPDGSFIEE